MGTLNKHDLIHFSGDLVRYRHPLNRRVIYTTGVRHIAEEGGAYWLIDAIAHWLASPDYLQATVQDDRLCYWMVWTLTVSEQGASTLEARADSGEPAFIVQNIEFTDFPLREIEIWAGIDGDHWTLYLPSEH
tara:strand:- start:78 stop:473 length:396 start_codon:yes stop_codon:yes gene_type:complete